MEGYLSKPVTAKTSTSGEGGRLRFGASTMQSWRPTMEDAHVTLPDFCGKTSLFAVFDGHGGGEVARFCQKFFADVLRRSPAFAEGRFKQALEESFLKMDELLASPAGAAQLKLLRGEPGSPRPGSRSSMMVTEGHVGCTALAVLITESSMFCANAGDSRAYLLDAEGKAVPMSTDHKPDIEAEVKRVKAAGGRISSGRVNETLNLTRAIGDLDFKKNRSLKPQDQIITAFPDVREFPLNPRPRLLLMGCDGIWETLPPPRVLQTAWEGMRGGQASLPSVLERLFDSLIGKDSETNDGAGCDNMTAIIVQFK